MSSDDEGSVPEVTYSVLFEGDDEASPYVHKDGRARASFPNGDTYEGEFSGGKRHGSGVYVWATGAEYRGGYKDGKRHGKGSLRTPDGGSYEGQWANGMRNGPGMYMYPGGDRYVGHWRDNLKHGVGVYGFADGVMSLKGTWVDGECVSGRWQNRDGTLFYGQFEKSQPQGPGVFVFSSGAAQSGYFVKREWVEDAWAPPAVGQLPPVPQQADAVTRAKRAVDVAVLKRNANIASAAGDDAEPAIADVANWRKVEDLPLLVAALPNSVDAIDSVVAHVAEKYEREECTWLNVRKDVVLYAGGHALAPRAKWAPDDRFGFDVEDVAVLDGLERYLAQRIAKESLVGQQVECVDGDHVPSTEVKTMKQVFEDKEQTMHRVPIQATGAVTTAQLQRLVNVVREIDESHAIVVVDEDGKDRATMAAVCVGLALRAVRGVEEEEAEEEEPEEEEEEEDEDDEDEDGEPKKAKKPKAPEPVIEAGDYANGWYTPIAELVKALGKNGIKIKDEVDAMLDKNSQAGCNVRLQLLDAKERNDIEAGRALLDAYFRLIEFNAYLKFASGEGGWEGQEDEADDDDDEDDSPKEVVGPIEQWFRAHGNNVRLLSAEWQWE